MKNVYWLLGSFFWSVYVQAAAVSLGTPPLSDLDPSMYEVFGQFYPVYANIETGPAIGSNAGGEELIWLGAHSSWASDDVSGIGESGVDFAMAIDVNLSNANGTSVTNGVSLVLSSATQIDWFVNVDTGVQLNNIFIISLGAEAHQLRVNRQQSQGNGVQSSFAPGTNATLDGVNVWRNSMSSNSGACGYELPTSDPSQGCNTEATLGLEAGDFSTQNELEAVQLASGTNLQLTSFNGSYYVNQFDVEIDSVIPLPASALLFGSALAAMAGLRRQVNSSPKTS